ncbi:MAG: lectin like domain-containing protein [Clostridium sp.]
MRQPGLDGERVYSRSDETLEAVGFYATAPDTEYEVYVFDGDLPW